MLPSNKRPLKGQRLNKHPGRLKDDLWYAYITKCGFHSHGPRGGIGGNLSIIRTI